MSNRLRELRKAAGLTQAELARRAGLRYQSHIADLEIGRIQAPTLPVAYRIARALGTEPATVFPPDPPPVRHGA
jgi:putative transcriptional regulator